MAALPRRQTRVLTWPIVTVFGFIARLRCAHVPEADRDPHRRGRLRVRLRVPIDAAVGDLLSLLDFARRIRGDQADLVARHDRRVVVHLDTGLRRIR